MHCPTLAELPPPPPGKTGWPWTQESPQLPEAIPNGSLWPRISIVTPSYNQVQFIEETIRSVLLQGYPNLEYVIIDGGSTDGSTEIIQQYEPWLTYWVSEPDRGQSHAINKGFTRCTGDLITFQNSDDIYLPGVFHDMALRWVERCEDVGAVIGGFHFMDANSKIGAEYLPPWLLHPGPIDLSLGPPGIYRLHQVATFYTRQALDLVGRWVREDMKYVMDRELLYRVCKKFHVLLVNRPFGAFRKHEESKSISQIIPFAQEFSGLYLLNISGNLQEDHLRKRMARYRLARGYVKYAKAVDGRLNAITALIKAAFYTPDYVFQRGYVRTWLDVMGIRSSMKS